MTQCPRNSTLGVYRSVLVALLLAVACAPANGPHRPSTGGDRDSTGTSAARGGLGYEQVRPIFAAICASCHPSRSGPDWLQYEQAKAYALNGQLTARVLGSKTMPPVGSPQAALITDNQRRQLAQWAQEGGRLQAVASGAEGRAEPAVAAVATDGGPERLCLQCHGTTGPGLASQPPMPRLNGQNFAYLVEQLENFKWRRRLDPSNAMNEIALATPMADLRRAARYFSEQPGFDFKESVAPGRLLSPIEALGRSYANSRCSSCHMNTDAGGRPPSSVVPALAGQSGLYLTNQLIQFRSGARQSSLMHEFARQLSDEEIEALSSYFSEVK